MQGDEVGDTAQDLPILRVAIAHPGEPFVEELAARLLGCAGGPVQELLRDGHLPGERHDGEAVGHAAGLRTLGVEALPHLLEGSQ
ncbi:hypothetical protein D9M70_531830 [compost metagenome]